MTSATTRDRRAESTGTAAGGLTAFAAVLLITCGVLDVFRGSMAVAGDEVFLGTREHVLAFDLASWGRVHLALGAVAVATGAGLVVTAAWARVVGVVLAALLIIANILDIPHHPFWSITVIALYGFIIWALCVVEPDSGSY